MYASVNFEVYWHNENYIQAVLVLYSRYKYITELDMLTAYVQLALTSYTTPTCTTTYDLAILTCRWGAVTVITGEIAEARIPVAFSSERTPVATVRRGR